MAWKCWKISDFSSCGSSPRIPRLWTRFGNEILIIVGDASIVASFELSNRNYIFIRSFLICFKRWTIFRIGISVWNCGEGREVNLRARTKYFSNIMNDDRSLNESRHPFHTVMVRPYLSTYPYKKRSILLSTVSFPASNLSRQIHSLPLFFHLRSKSISNEQTIRFEPTAKRLLQKSRKSSITNLNFTGGVLRVLVALDFSPFFSFLFSLLFFSFLASSLPYVACLVSRLYQKSVGNYVLLLIVLGNSSFRKFSTSIEDRRSFSLASISLQRE